MGMAALTLAYVGMAVLGLSTARAATVLVVTHLAALALLWFWATRADPTDPVRLHRLLHARVGAVLREYLIVPAAVLSA